MKNLFRKLNQNTHGFTLVECCIALVMTVIGLLASYSLIVYAVRNYSMSRDLVIANSLAKAKIEEISNSPQPTGGSLANNVTGYFDSPTDRFIRRWQINSNSFGTKTINVTIIMRGPGVLLPDVNIATRIR